MSRRVAGVARGGQRSADEIIKKAKAADKISSYLPGLTARRSVKPSNSPVPARSPCFPQQLCRCAEKTPTHRAPRQSSLRETRWSHVETRVVCRRPSAPQRTCRLIFLCVPARATDNGFKSFFMLSATSISSVNLLVGAGMEYAWEKVIVF